MNSRQLFEKQLSELTAVLNQNLQGNQDILDTIKWCKDEYVKIPFSYPGDEYVVSCIKNQAYKGFSLTESIEAAKKVMINDIKIDKFYQAQGR